MKTSCYLFHDWSQWSSLYPVYQTDRAIQTKKCNTCHAVKTRIVRTGIIASEISFSGNISGINKELELNN